MRDFGAAPRPIDRPPGPRPAKVRLPPARSPRAPLPIVAAASSSAPRPRASRAAAAAGILLYMRAGLGCREKAERSGRYSISSITRCRRNIPGCPACPPCLFPVTPFPTSFAGNNRLLFHDNRSFNIAVLHP